MESYIELGSGFFIIERDTGDNMTVVLDGNSEEPTDVFGPAAWNGGPGPSSGKRVIELWPLLQGTWQQVSYDDWRWIADDGREFEDRPNVWPQSITVLEGRFQCALRSLDGQTAASLDDLIKQLVREMAILGWDAGES